MRTKEKKFESQENIPEGCLSAVEGRQAVRGQNFEIKSGSMNKRDGERDTE